MESNRQKIALLGSTGSIGEQTLDVVRRWSDSFEITTLTSYNNWERLGEQAAEFMPDSVVIGNRAHYDQLRQALEPLDVKVYAGPDALRQVVAGGNVDTVVNAIVGYAGLEPAVAALEAGKKLALANKESLVAGGAVLMRLSAENRAPIVPIDSEHSAILQCLMGEVSPVSRMILTASGGPFLDTPAAELKDVTVAGALMHPNWTMGAKISVDSATLMNKGFEVIEARWLFGVEPSQIEVVVHPESIVHSMVEFADGSVKAQLGPHDMRIPIQYALTFPERWEIGGEKFNFAAHGALTFREPDTQKFPMLGFAYDAMDRGGNAGCVLNGANEEAVAAFIAGRIRFTAIPQVVEHTLGRAGFVAAPTIADLRETDHEARRIASEYIARQEK
ncbi:1-deoxy-D-xylulose-5-phosphate reductoisomerase [Alistipes sp. OttesenSCG-928-B03]|nr:1-deoxy-D-xylulose-5-phosphate reductoisomerase [Alistipes sp. OttesenSCG-928-B03]